MSVNGNKFWVHWACALQIQQMAPNKYTSNDRLIITILTLISMSCIYTIEAKNMKNKQDTTKFAGGI